MSPVAKDRKKRAIGTCLVLLVLASLPAGCGGGGSDKSEIESTLNGYLTDFVSGDGGGVCEAMSGTESRGVTESIGESEPAFKSLSCPEVMTKVSETLGDAERVALEEIEIEEVMVSGDTARVEISTGGQRVLLRKIDGSWRITGGGLR